jgi:hypothetical protein
MRYGTKIQELCIPINAADSFDDVQRVMTSIGVLKSLLKVTVEFFPNRQRQAQISWVVDSLSQLDNLSSIKLYHINYDGLLGISPQALIGLVKLPQGLTKLEVHDVRFQKQWVKTRRKRRIRPSSILTFALIMLPGVMMTNIPRKQIGTSSWHGGSATELRFGACETL